MWTPNQPVPFTQTTVTGGPFAAGSTAIGIASTGGSGMEPSSRSISTTVAQSSDSIGRGHWGTINFYKPLWGLASAGNAILRQRLRFAFGNLQLLAADSRGEPSTP